jgi:hypothetical protein
LRVGKERKKRNERGGGSFGGVGVSVLGRFGVVSATAFCLSLSRPLSAMRFFESSLAGCFRSAAAAVLVGSALLGAAGCAGSGEARSREFRQSFRRAFERYQDFEADKSMALARDANGNWAFGFARGQQGEMQAVNKARQQCEQQRARYEVASRCQTYAVGEEITGDPALVRAEE